MDIEPPPPDNSLCKTIGPDSVRTLQGTARTWVAPLWHTAAILGVFAVWIALGRSRHTGDAPHLINYGSQILITWLLFGSMVAGVYDRRAFFVASLQQSAAAWRVEIRRAFGIYFGFLFSLVVTVGIAVAVSQFVHPANPLSATHEAASSTGSGSATRSAPLPAPSPTSLKPAPNLPGLSHYFRSKSVVSLAPRSGIELLMWFAVCFTAGFCEEHVFRGYLLQQALALFSRHAFRPAITRVLAILLTSILFGSLHLYEGVGGAAVITALGALYAVLALRFGNLRAVILAHTLQDFLAGIYIYVAHAHGRI